MSREVKAPHLPESVAEATVLQWRRKVGDKVQRGDNLVDLETDKVVLDVPAPISGVLREIIQPEGAVVTSEEVLALLESNALVPTQEPVAAAVSTEQAEAPQANPLSPAVQRMVMEYNLDASLIKGSGRDGRILKEDVLSFLRRQQEPSSAADTPTQAETVPTGLGSRAEKRVPMTRLRSRIAERLVESQHATATLTTFNEVNMQALLDLRARHRDQFEQRYNVRLGFMGFFVKAVVSALKRFPVVNASISDQDVVYHEFYDIGIAVASQRGLVVPILRDVDRLDFHEIESAIGEFATKAKEGRLSLEELSGGTFTISNGGVFGSLLSTPILNPPQSAILGMHKIEQRAVVEEGGVVARPMMYLALSYDHRLIDGKEAVQFLVAIKEVIEDPTTLLLGL